MMRLAALLFFLFFLFSPAFIKNSDYVKIAFVGDLFLGGPVQENYILKRDSIDENLLNILNSADFFIANLECVLSYHEKEIPKKYHLFALPEAGTYLDILKPDAVTLANNHIKDYGVEGVLDTISYLEKLKIKFTGAGKDLHFAMIPAKLGEIDGKNVLLFGFSDISHFVWANEKEAGALPAKKSIIKKALKNYPNDFKIVYFHFGKEYVKNVTKRQEILAHFAIDNGADLVIGAHSHVVQRYEFYKGKPIFYGLGNFLFDIDDKPITKIGLMPIIYYNKIKKNFFAVVYYVKSKPGNYFPHLLRREIFYEGTLQSNLR